MKINRIIEILLILRQKEEVSSMYISQVRRKSGIEVVENYNLAKSEDAKQP